MFDAWNDLPNWVRMTVAVGVLGLGLILTLTGYQNHPETKARQPDRGALVEADTTPRRSRAQFRVGVVALGIGTVLLMICGKSKAEKSGYNF